MLVISAHRLPAPIQEVPESPTPAPEQSAKQKSKRTVKPKANENSESQAKTASSPKSRSTPNPRPFAGTWVGKTSGATRITIVISPAQDSAVAKGVGGIWGDRGGPATVKGNTLSWNFLYDKWVMVIAPDGKTAVVTGYGWPGTFTGTFEKVP